MESSVHGPAVGVSRGILGLFHLRVSDTEVVMSACGARRDRPHGAHDGIRSLGLLGGGTSWIAGTT